MAFSRKQHIVHFRPMVDRAWRTHCDNECITDSTAASKKDWYRRILLEEFKVDSTEKLNPKGDFDRAMALFEEIAGDGIEWQVNLNKGDSKRARFKLRKTIEELRLTEEYVRAIARQMKVSESIDCLTSQQAISLRLALLKYVRRKQDRYVSGLQEGELAIE